ncbi:MAG: carbohydrate ABC transporter permease [Actinobacteria bacterium]|nr:carbohydrate ABC transporter permease [Actinomycetota bacterium]
MTALMTETESVVTAPSVKKKPRGRRRQGFLNWVAVHCVAIALAVAFMVPILFVLLTSFMDAQQALTKDLWPRTWHPENFLAVFERAPMLLFLGNSILYSGLATLFMLLSSVPVAYALARLQWRGRTAAFYIVIVAMLLPAQVTAVPMYVVWAHLGLTGTLWPLILPNLFGDAFSIFLIRQFLVTIPPSYSDAARVDGASEWQTLRHVILPMAKPGIAAAALFSFLNTWNDYFGPLLYTGEKPGNWTLSLGLASFRGQHHVDWNLTMAATVLVMLPIVVLFFLAQKQFVEGIKFSGVKG